MKIQERTHKKDEKPALQVYIMCGKRFSESDYLKRHTREWFFLGGKYEARAHR